MTNDLRARLRIEGNADGAVEAVTKLLKAIKTLADDGKDAKRGMEDAAAGARTLETNTKGASFAAKALGTALGYLGLRELTRNIVDAAFAVKGFETGLGAVAGGAMGARAEIGFVREEAARLGLDLRKAEQSFLSLAGATNGTALAGEQTRKIWQGVMETGLAMGRSNEQIGRGLEAISQVASKGVVSMEEIRGQLAEAIPGAVNIAARALGVGTAELNEMIASGELLASDFLPKFAAQLQSEFGPAVEKYLTSDLGRARQEIAQLQTALFDLSAVAGESFLAGVIDGFSELNDTLSDDEMAREVRALAHALGELTGEGARALAFLADNAELVVVAFGALAGLRAGVMLGEIGAKAVAAAEGVGVLSTAMGALGGPIAVVAGLGVAAVTALNISFAEQEEKVRAASAAQDQHNQLMGDAAQLLEEAGLDAKQWGVNIGGSVSPTNDLAGATRGLADETFRLADARRQAAVEELRANSAELQTRIDDIEKRKDLRDRFATPGWIQLFGTPEQKAAHSARINAEDNTTQEALRGQIASNSAAAIALTLAPNAEPAAKAHEAVAASADKRAKKTDEAREAERRLAAADDIVVQAKLETQALAERAVAAMKGEEALEELRVQEAALQVLQRLGVASLDELTGKVKEHAAAAIDAAQAAERQAMVTEKAERVGAASRNLDRAIASEQRRAQAIAGGTLALTAFNQAEDIRQSVEAVGLTLTAEQVALLEEKELKLAQIAAANDNAEYLRQQAEELRLLELTNDERDIENRALEIRVRLRKQGLEITQDEAKLQAKKDQAEEEAARAIGDLKEDLRQAFIETGELAFDDVADYAGRKLRKAVYDALLAEPIELIINAVVGNISGLTGSGGIGSLLAGTLLGDTLGGSLIGSSLGQSLGLGTGNGGADAALSLVGSGLGSAFAGSTLSTTLATAIGSSVSGAIGTAAATGLTGLLASSAVLGPLGAIAGLALGSLFKDDQRPYARADIGIVGGEFAVTGSQSLDGGPVSEMEAAAAQITESLNAAADLFKLDLTKVSNLPTSIGYVQGKNTGALSEGYFGGDGGGFSTGAQFEGYTDASALAEDIVRATIIRAIEAGASDLSEAEKRVVTQAADLEEAANKIALGRSIAETIDDAILQLTDPAAFERQEALDAIEESYQALKAQAEELIAAGLVSGDVMAKLDELKALQIDEALANLGGTAAEAEAALREAWDREVSSLTAHAAELERSADALAAYRRDLYLGAAAGLSPEEQYKASKAEFERVDALARSGDEDALAQLPTTSQQFLEASRAYYGSSAAYFKDLEAVRASVTAAEALARSQADTLLQQLEVQKESLKTLIAINDNIVSLPQAIADLINAKAADGTLDTSSAELPAWFDWEQYGADNPDLLKARADGTALTEFGSDREALEQHYLRIGKDEIAAGTRYYAMGGVFTNQVVTQPTTFDIGKMAEAGPEAIMPLFMGPRGLGVVTTSNDNGRTEALLAAVLVELQALVRLGSASAEAQLASLSELADELAANTRAMAAA